MIASPPEIIGIQQAQNSLVPKRFTVNPEGLPDANQV
jgi:hypothetical protein